jgi:transcriptional regulator with XRE-family HTH domain
MASRRARPSKLVWSVEYAAFRVRLITARELAGLTQHEAARLLGRSQSFVAKSETGERRVDVVELIEFARVYRKPLTFFAPGDRPPRKSSRRG